MHKWNQWRKFWYGAAWERCGGERQGAGAAIYVISTIETGLKQWPTSTMSLVNSHTGCVCELL